MELLEAEKIALDQVASIHIKENVALRAQLIIMQDTIKVLNAQLESLKASSAPQTDGA